MYLSPYARNGHIYMDPQAHMHHTQPKSLPVHEDIQVEDTGVEKLPSELWLEIFALGKRLDDTCLFASDGTHSNHIDSVTAISQVCSSFRHLAINSPMLWTAIYINRTSCVSNIQRRINRSRPLTLDIAICFAEGNAVSASVHGGTVDTFMDMVIDEIARWRSFRIRLDEEQLGRPVVMRLRGHMALSLEYLSISVKSREPGYTPPVPHIFNYGAPRLASTKLRGVAHTFYRPPLADVITLRLEGIGHLRMNFLTFVAVITQPTRLRHLMIRTDVVSPDVWALQSPGSLPLKELRSLHMYSESGALYAGFLLAVDSPQLWALTLEGVFDRDLNLLWSGASPQKFGNLSRLTFITEDDMSSTTYVKACRMFPNITDYTTQRATASNSSVVTMLNGKLKQPNGEQFIGWPKLQTLNLALDSSAESMEYIRRVVQARIVDNCPLEQICFFRSENLSWMSPDEWSIRLEVTVKLVGHTEVLPGDISHTDVDDVCVVHPPQSLFEAGWPH